MTDFSWARYQVRIVVPVASLEQSFAMQEWCQAHLGEGWASAPPGSRAQEWYFVEESDATLFRLKWM